MTCRQSECIALWVQTTCFCSILISGFVQWKIVSFCWSCRRRLVLHRLFCIRTIIIIMLICILSSDERILQLSAHNNVGCATNTHNMFDVIWRWHKSVDAIAITTHIRTQLEQCFALHNVLSCATLYRLCEKLRINPSTHRHTYTRIYCRDEICTFSSDREYAVSFVIRTVICMTPIILLLLQRWLPLMLRGYCYYQHDFIICYIK